MKLCKRYLEVPGTAVYFWTQAGHRQSAIDLAVGALHDLPSDSDDPFSEMSVAMRQWTIEAVFQGAWVREYHHWETDTKAYFKAMHGRNGSSEPNWRVIAGSHVQKVRAQLALFSVAEPASLTLIDAMRLRLNETKHEGGYLATAQDYGRLAEAISSFWGNLDEQESVDYRQGLDAACGHSAQLREGA